MPAATPARAAARLRHAVLLAALLAVIAGFLGMHILSGSHGMHSQAPPSAPPDTTAAHPAGHGTHDATARDSVQLPDATGAGRHRLHPRARRGLPRR